MTDDELIQALEATTRQRRFELVLEARQRGWAYTKIGKLLGMTRQAVHKMVVAEAENAPGMVEPGQPSGLDPDRS